MTDSLSSNSLSAKTSGPPPSIVVIGSINMDLVVGCESLPKPGETITALHSCEVNGGKGANQAVAAARAGGRVRLIGRVGDDSFAARLIGQLDAEGIDCRGVQRTSDCASGLAVVAVESSGQNSIMVVPNANGRVTTEDVAARRDLIETADVVLLQLEIPTLAVLASIEIAQRAGRRVVLDPAPVPLEWDDGLLNVDLVCPNETEAAKITGLPVQTVADAKAAARQLQQRGARNVAITMGDRGTVLLAKDTFHHIPTFQVTAIDTTAAGDAFAGALAVHWAETNDLVAAVQLGSAAGAFAASRAGAQPSMGSRREIISLRSQLP